MSTSIESSSLISVTMCQAATSTVLPDLSIMVVTSLPGLRSSQLDIRLRTRSMKLWARLLLGSVPTVSVMPNRLGSFLLAIRKLRLRPFVTGDRLKSLSSQTIAAKFWSAWTALVAVQSVLTLPGPGRSTWSSIPGASPMATGATGLTVGGPAQVPAPGVPQSRLTPAASSRASGWTAGRAEPGLRRTVVVTIWRVRATPTASVDGLGPQVRSRKIRASSPTPPTAYVESSWVCGDVQPAYQPEVIVNASTARSEVRESSVAWTAPTGS